MSLRHNNYKLTAFPYSAYPTITIQIGCYDEAGNPTECYTYSFTWSNIWQYEGWLPIAAAMVVTGNVATRNQNMFDALNRYLRQNYPVSNRDFWVLIAKNAGVCPPPPSNIGWYWTFDETSGPFVDSANAYTLARDLMTNIAGIIDLGVTFPNGVYDSPASSGGPTWTNGTSPGISVWFWYYDALIFPKTLQVGLSTDGLGFNGSNYFSVVMNRGFSGGTLLTKVETTGGVNNFLPAPTVARGQWTFIAVTWDALTDTLTAYLNGTVYGTIAGAGCVLADGDMLLSFEAGPITVGCDELGASTKTVLTPTQVNDLWNAGAGVTWPGVSLIVG